MLKAKYAPGEPVPWFVARSTSNSEYHFGSVAGRHAVLLFLGSASSPLAAPLYDALLARRELFDDERTSLFVTTIDPRDEGPAGLRQLLPGIRIFWDLDASISARFGVASPELDARGGREFIVAALVLDPSLRVMRWFGGTSARIDFAAELIDWLERLPYPRSGAAQPQAPVLLLPRVFEPELCRELIGYYERTGGKDSGYMKNLNGRIEGVVDYSVKRRDDCLIEDETLRHVVAARIQTRLNPELRRVFRFDATRMERYLVARYSAEVGGYFRPHRDNNGDGHREFAVTINLNEAEYEGGDLCFPEYGRQTYRAVTGGACIFSCGLMHEATPVTRGQRYAFLPFLYDDAAARRREANNAKYVDATVHYHYDGPQ
ncbi:MAG: 2OG-Fe(II) oxygenase [Caldimonas sp.]